MIMYKKRIHNKEINIMLHDISKEDEISENEIENAVKVEVGDNYLLILK